MPSQRPTHSPNLPSAIAENLLLLVAEVDAQCAGAQQAFAKRGVQSAHAVIDREGYAINLKGRVQGGCVQAIATGESHTPQQLVTLSETSELAHQLERITDKLRDLCQQRLLIKDSNSLPTQRGKTTLQTLRNALENWLAGNRGLDQLDAAVIAKQARKALRQGTKLQSTVTATLADPAYTSEDFAHILLMANALCQAADALQRISDSILSMQLGQPMNMGRYRALQSVIAEYPALTNGELTPLAQTRSGSTISQLIARDSNQPPAVFKDGLKEKVRKERKGVESWHKVFPGLAPRILAYQKQGDGAALLIEHLPGYTFEHILLNEPEPLLDAALDALNTTLRNVWRKTRTDTAQPANFMAQLEARLPAITSAHGTLLQSQIKVGAYRPANFKQLIKRAARIEKTLPPSFSVYIHGDFNVDNIIFDPTAERIHFIDLHRSRYMDYLQDVSVFMVSCFRLPKRAFTDADRRSRVVLAMDTTARRFANASGDEFYDIRLALGLARSFASSIRFTADRTQAKSLLNRARYLLERVTSVDARDYPAFKAPLREIFCDFE